MKTEKEIRLQRLAVFEAVQRFPAHGWQRILQGIKAGQPESESILESIAKISLVFDILNWVLDESKGKTMSNAISEVENLSRYFKTGKYSPRWSLERILSTLRENIKESPELNRRVLEDKKKLLGIPWDELESKEN